MEVILHRSRRTREKKCASWERYVYGTDGIFMYRAARIALRYPRLTPNQLRVAALASELLPNHEIARILGTTERAVEKVRSRIRKTLALPAGISLTTTLLALLAE